MNHTMHNNILSALTIHKMNAGSGIRARDFQMTQAPLMRYPMSLAP